MLTLALLILACVAAALAPATVFWWRDRRDDRMRRELAAARWRQMTAWLNEEGYP